MKVLILAEKPSLSKEIAHAISSDISKNQQGFWEDENVIVANLVGHVLKQELPNDKWDINNIPLKLSDLKYTPISNKKKLVKDLVNAIKRNDIDEICSAGDADQEGSLLVHEILMYAGAYKLNKTLSRMWILAMDKKTLLKAYLERYNLKKDYPFIHGGLARSYADMVIGINLTQLYTLKFAPPKTVYSIGRVQTPTLKLVRIREKQIEDFTPQNFKTVKGFFSKDLTADFCYYDQENKLQTRIFNNNFNDEAEKKFSDKKYIVKEVNEELKSKKPDYLPNLNDVLKSVSKLYKYKAKSITSDIQILYESKLISYPRSESRFLPCSMENDIKNILSSFDCPGTSFDVSNKRIFNDAKVEAHFAIIPLGNKPGNLSTSQTNIYNYIRDKFLMVFMSDYKYKASYILLQSVKSEEIYFQAKGNIEVEKGYKSYKSVLNKNKEDVILPDARKGDYFDLHRYIIKDDVTRPPSLLTEAELLSIMENIYSIYKKESDEDLLKEKFSLGTPATRGGIIEILFKRGFITGDKKGFLNTTDIGREILEIDNNNIGVKLTAEFELKMGLIQKGKGTRKSFEKEIEDFTYSLINNIKKLEDRNQEDKKPDRITGEKCPQCDAEMVEKQGKFGLFTSCSNYPKCKYIKKEQRVIEEGYSEFVKGFKLTKEGVEYVIWKKSFGRKFSSAEAQKLFNGQELAFTNFISKNKAKFSAKCKFNIDKKKLELIFNN